MALDTAAKRAAAAHVKRLAKGVTSDATAPKPAIWRYAVGWNYGGNVRPPATSAGGILDPHTLATKESLSVTGNPTLGGRWSW